MCHMSPPAPLHLAHTREYMIIWTLVHLRTRLLHPAHPVCLRSSASMPTRVVEVFWAATPRPWAEQRVGNNLVTIMLSPITSERLRFFKKSTSIWNYKTKRVSGNSHDANQFICKYLLLCRFFFFLYFSVRAVVRRARSSRNRWTTSFCAG